MTNNEKGGNTSSSEIKISDVPSEFIEWLKKRGVHLDDAVSISIVANASESTENLPIDTNREALREVLEEIHDPIELLFIREPDSVSTEIIRKFGLGPEYAYECTTPQPNLFEKDFPGFVLHFARKRKDDIYEQLDVYLADDWRKDKNTELNQYMGDSFKELSSPEGWESIDMRQELEGFWKATGRSRYQAFVNLARETPPFPPVREIEVYKKNGFYLIQNMETKKRVLISENNPLFEELYCYKFWNYASDISKADQTGGSCFGIRHGYEIDWKKIYEDLGLTKDEDGKVHYKE